MLLFKTSLEKAINESQAVIEFTPDGYIMNANENFLRIMGYEINEIKGKHHQIFLDYTKKSSVEYQDFWKKLSAGNFHQDEFMRIKKNGEIIWFQATYHPIKSILGKITKIIKIATDITQKKIQNIDNEGQIMAIYRSQAIITFNVIGIILDANDKFLEATGYSYEELIGQHHSILMPEAERNSLGYKQFWANLTRGQYQANHFKRMAKNGNELWINATYTPIIDDTTGDVIKIIKIATQITERPIRSDVRHIGLRNIVD